MPTTTTKKEIIAEITAISIWEINTKFNIRHGWNEEGMGDTYLDGVEGLIHSIKSKGFKPSEPLEVYLSSEDGKTYLKEGHRRYAACKSIILNDTEAILAKVKPSQSGMVWVVYVDEPTDVLELVSDQFDANRSQGNTILDEAKAYCEYINQVITDEKGKTLGKAEKVKILSRRFNRLGSIIKQLVDFYSFVDVKILNWIQDGLVNEENDSSVILTFNSAKQLCSDIGYKNGNTVLLAVLARVIKQQHVELYGRSIKASWLKDLANKMFPPPPPVVDNKKNSTSINIDEQEGNPAALDGFIAQVSPSAFIQKHEDDAYLHSQIVKVIYDYSREFIDPEKEISRDARVQIASLVQRLNASHEESDRDNLNLDDEQF